MQYIRNFLIPWASLALLLTGTAYSQTIHISHCDRQCPDSGAQSDIVVHHLYAAAVDSESGLAHWVAYKVIRDSVGVASLLPRVWQSDRLLDAPDSALLEPADEADFFQPDLSNAQDREYRVNEILYNMEDRGRLAPLTSFAGTPYWDELNNLSNMAPLPTDLRVGSWARLEQAINALVQQIGDVYVVSGPMARTSQEISQPNAYFKVVVAGDRLASFVFPAGLKQNERYCDQRGSLAAIEQATGLTLFPALSALDDGALLRDIGCGDSE